MSRLPSTGPSLQRYLRQQARTAQRQQQSSSFARSGTSVTAENVTQVDGELVVNGTETVNGPLVVHGTAAFDGTTTIGGNAAITGTLSLPAGIIDNAALANPVDGNTGNANSGTVTFTTGYVTYATVTIAVPAGFSVAKVVGISFVSCPGGVAIQARTRISGNLGNAMVVAGQFSGASHAITLTGLSGGNITIATDVLVSTSSPGAANTSALVTFLR